MVQVLSSKISKGTGKSGKLYSLSGHQKGKRHTFKVEGPFFCPVSLLTCPFTSGWVPSSVLASCHFIKIMEDLTPKADWGLNEVIYVNWLLYCRCFGSSHYCTLSTACQLLHGRICFRLKHNSQNNSVLFPCVGSQPWLCGYPDKETWSSSLLKPGQIYYFLKRLPELTWMVTMMTQSPCPVLVIVPSHTLLKLSFYNAVQWFLYLQINKVYLFLWFSYKNPKGTRSCLKLQNLTWGFLATVNSPLTTWTQQLHSYIDQDSILVASLKLRGQRHAGTHWAANVLVLPLLVLET